MLPELSRRIGKVMNAPSMRTLSLDDKEDFVRRVMLAERFSDLDEDVMQIVLAAEKEIEALRMKKVGNIDWAEL